MRLSDENRVKHLLNRFGLGASVEDLEYYGARGWESAIERLIHDDREEVDVALPSSFFDGTLPGLRRMSQLQGHWYRRLIVTRRPLQHRMLLFWHDHFATGSSKVRQAQVMMQHMDTLFESSLKPFREILDAVSKDPAMLIWLDSQDNKKGTPNENFSRELMELFTMGVDNGYTEMDVREVARSFTGWTFNQSRSRRTRGVSFSFNADDHDDGQKVILKSEGRFGGEDVLDILCMQEETPQFLVQKFWEYFAYENPESELVERLSKGFRSNGLSITWLLKAIMFSDEFYSAKAVGTKVKSPVDFCVSTARMIGVQRRERVNTDRPEAFGSLLKVATSEMGMELLEPPDVAGWPSGLGWISAATMVKRINWAALLFLGEEQSMTRNRRQAPPFTAREFFSAGTPEAFADELIKVLDAQLTSDQRAIVRAAAVDESGGRLTENNFNAVGAATAKVIFGSPRFQFS